MYLKDSKNENQCINTIDTRDMIFDKLLNKLNIILPIASLAIFAIIIFLFNHSTVFIHMDDFNYSTAKNFTGVINSTIWEWTNLNGRLWTDFTLRFITLFDKFVFNIANTIVFILVNLFITKYATLNLNLSNVFKTIIWTFSVLATLLFIPDQQILFWMAGSANYMFASLYLLITFYYFYKVIVDNIYSTDTTHISITKFILILFVSLFAGNCNENSSLAVILMAIVSLIYFIEFKINYDKKIVFFIVALIIGYLMLVFSPGTIERIKYASHGSGITIQSLLIRFLSLVFRYYEQFLIANTVYLLIFVFLCSYKFFYKADEVDSKELGLSFFLYLSSLFTNFVLVFSPAAPERAKTFAFFLLVIAILRLVSICLTSFKTVKPIILSIYVASLTSLIPLNIVLLNSLLHRQMFDKNIKYIIEMKKTYGYDEIEIDDSRQTIIDDKDYKIPECIKNLTCYAYIMPEYAGRLGIKKIIVK